MLQELQPSVVQSSRHVSEMYLMQGHVDMVTEKNNDVNHDFYNDPLRLQRDGAWLKVHGHRTGAAA